MAEFLWIILSYLLGCIPSGLLVARCAGSIDPRCSGSGNVGATNVARLCGFGWGVLTLLGDVGKGFAATAIALCINQDAVFLSLVACAALVGHRWSFFMGFKGGKAVATSIGVFLPLALGPLLASVVLCVGIIVWSGFVSLGSLALVLSLPLFLLLAGAWSFIPLALIVAVLVICAHKENIMRLLRKEEKPWRKPA